MEYMVFETSSYAIDLENKLNKYAAQGWRLVFIENSRYILERKTQNDV
jgi:hypothetical protein